jgi:heme O synthase-like polyprenyltransferase
VSASGGFDVALLNHHSSLLRTAKALLRGAFAARLPGFVALMKPRVMSLAVFAAFVGLAIVTPTSTL